MLEADIDKENMVLDGFFYSGDMTIMSFLVFLGYKPGPLPQLILMSFETSLPTGAAQVWCNPGNAKGADACLFPGQEAKMLWTDRGGHRGIGMGLGYGDLRLISDEF